MTEEIGTLKELNVKAGDVVWYILYADGGEGCYGYPFTIDDCGYAVIDHGEGFFCADSPSIFKLISRAGDEDRHFRLPEADNPRTWAEMTDAEKGALLLAEHRGKVIECWTDGRWMNRPPMWRSYEAYRVRPEPKRETVEITGSPSTWFGTDRCARDTHRITFDLIDGEPDPASIKMERIE